MLKKSSFEVDKNFHIIQQQQFQDTVFSMDVVSQNTTNTTNTIHNPTQHNTSSYGKKLMIQLLNLSENPWMYAAVNVSLKII